MLWGVVVRFGEKCALLVWFFSHEFIRPNFLSSGVDCRTKHNKRGESRALNTNESASENATQKKRVLITNSPVVGTVENEIDFFSVRPFRSTLCWRNETKKRLNAYQGERPSISSNVSNFFPSV